VREKERKKEKERKSKREKAREIQRASLNSTSQTLHIAKEKQVNHSMKIASN